jgi:hypothetical protein
VYEHNQWQGGAKRGKLNNHRKTKMGRKPATRVEFTLFDVSPPRERRLPMQRPAPDRCRHLG